MSGNGISGRNIFGLTSGRSMKTGVTVLLVVLVLAAAGLAIYSALRRSNDDRQWISEANNQLEEIDTMGSRSDYKGQAKSLQKMLDANPREEEAQIVILRLAAAYANDKQYDKAIETYKTALDKYPGSKVGAYRGLATLYRQRGKDTKNKDDLQQSIAYFEKTLELEKKDSQYASYVETDEGNIRYGKELIDDL